jgi:hypothetical protein
LEIKESDDFVVVIGYGVVGKVVCDLLDTKLMKYVGLELNPNKAIQARNLGLPVFYGDIGRQEVAHAFNVGKAKAAIVCVAEKQQCNRICIALRRWYPDLKIFARAKDQDHAERLQNTLDVAAMVPILPEDNLLLTLPFGGACMKALGVPPEEVNAILETKRKQVLSGRGLNNNEVEQELAQLGIAPAPKVSFPVNGTEVSSEDDEEYATSISDAAHERRVKALEKSPFVASVIEGVSPDSKNEKEKGIKEEETTVIDAVVTTDSLTSSGDDGEKLVVVGSDDE